MMEIAFLKQFPEHLETIVHWVYPEWWAGRSTFEEVAALYRSLLNDRQLPIAFIALYDGVPAGTALICDRDPDITLDIGPWLEGLFVPEVFRNRGIGSALVNTIAETAATLGFNLLYLSSHVENYYERLGFATVKILENRDLLFRKSLQ